MGKRVGGCVTTGDGEFFSVWPPRNAVDSEFFFRSRMGPTVLADTLGDDGLMLVEFAPELPGCILKIL